MEEEKKLEFVLMVNDYPTLNPELEQVLDEANEFLSDANANFDDIKENLLTSMLENQIYSAKLGKYTISVVTGNDTVVFDTDAFVMKEPDDVVEAFTTITSEETFDLEKFKEENPELYKKYVKINDRAEVDTKRLSGALPKVFNRYATVIPTKKKPTIRIAKSKGEK